MFWSEGFLKIFWRKGISLAGWASFSEKMTFEEFLGVVWFERKELEGRRE